MKPAKVGRPRANPRRLSRPPEDEILHAAAKLFADKGFGSTSTREIATAAGLRQPSLFHYFPNKEAMLEALLERSIQAPIEFIERLRAESGRASVKLYRALRFDVRHVCAFPFDLRAVLSAEARRPRFRRLWKERDRLIVGLRSFIAEGVESGEFVPVDAEIAANALFAMDEWTLSWFRRAEWTPERIAAEVATLALRALLAEPSRIDEIRRLASDDP